VPRGAIIAVAERHSLPFIIIYCEKHKSKNWQLLLGWDKVGLTVRQGTVHQNEQGILANLK
jgi:hypothetical protein